ncbi:MAG TPA: WcbI family polysaccharide biosynthesis putative acetyltransferase [Trebonia sp.]
MSSSAPLVVVWGNCQAKPIAALIESPARAAGLRVAQLPPVFEIGEAGLEHLRRDVLPRTAVLISQPVRDEYRIPGCGTSQLAELLPGDARLITFPVTYDTSAFPYQVNAHLGSGERVDAPITGYHDLRVIAAAQQGLSVNRAAAWWPAPTANMVIANARNSQAELRRREQPLDVYSSDLLLDGLAMHTFSHPTNLTLVKIARRIVAALGLPGEPEIAGPEREFLGESRAPIEAAVVDALGWPQSDRREEWIIAKKKVPPSNLLQQQLDFYAARPGIADDTRTRFADRLALLGL